MLPLIERMAAAGLDRLIALATDIAEPGLWKRRGAAPGLPGFVEAIGQRMRELALGKDQVANLLGKNIIRRLAVDQSAVQFQGAQQ